MDGIMARVFAHSNVETLADYAGVPVINGLSDAKSTLARRWPISSLFTRKRGGLRGLISPILVTATT